MQGSYIPMLSSFSLIDGAIDTTATDTTFNNHIQLQSFWENISFSLVSSCISWASFFFIYYLFQKTSSFLKQLLLQKLSLSIPVLQLQGLDVGHWCSKHRTAGPHRKGLRLLPISAVPLPLWWGTNMAEGDWEHNVKQKNTTIILILSCYSKEPTAWSILNKYPLMT